MKGTRKFIAGLTTFLILGMGSLAFAQQTSSIHGSVVDSNGDSLPGVVVVIESPNMQGSRSATTTANGEFLFRLLVPGDYTVTASMPGMQTAKSTVGLGLGQTSKPKLTMNPEATSVELVVTASVDPVLDTTDVVANFDAEFVDNIASGRDIRSRTLLAPGTTQSGVNGSVSISGAQTFENSYMLDGGNISFDNVRGSASFIVIPDAIQETSISTASVSAEFGQFTGGLVNTITKSGGNSFSGVLRSALRNDDWVGTTPLEDEGNVPHADDIVRTDSISIGGPIIKDRLWFHVSGSRFRSQQPGQLIAATPLTDAEAADLGLSGGQFAPGVRQVDSSRDNDKVNLKLTGKIYEGHEMVLSYSDETDDALNSTGRGPLGINAAINNIVPEQHLSANYRGILTPEWTVEALYTEKKSTFEGAGAAGDGDLRFTETVLRDRNFGGRFGAEVLKAPTDETRDHESLMVKTSYFLTTNNAGSHDIVVGLQDQTDSRMGNNHQSASGWEFWDVYPVWDGPDDLEPTPWFGGGGAATLPTQLIWWPIVNESIGSDFNTRSAFVNDRWTFNDNLSFNIGARYDKNDASAEDGKPVSSSDHLSPRVAIEYDLAGDGRHRFTGSYAEYVARLNDAGQQASTAGSPSYAVWYYYGPATNNIADVFAWIGENNGGNADSTRDPFLNDFWQTAPFTNINISPDPANIITTVDPGLESPNAREFRVGYSTSFDRGFFKADVINRDYKDFYATHLFQAEAGPEFGITPSGVDRRVLTNDDENYERTYNAVQMQFQYRVADNFNLAGNYTWSQSIGNFIGETEGQAAISGSATTFYPEYNSFDARSPRGYLDGDQRHIARIFALYDLSTRFGDFNFSATQRFESGAAYSAAFTVNFRNDPAAWGLPTRDQLSYSSPGTTTTYFVDGRRGQFNGEDMTQTDLGVNYSVKLWKIEFFAEFNLYNIFDEDAAVYPNNGWVNTTVRSTGTPFNVFTETPVEGVHYEFDPGFGTPLEGNGVTGNSAYQLPFTYTLDVGLRF